MAVPFSQNQRLFASTLARQTGLNPATVEAWMTAEEPPGAQSGYQGTQDWLNVGITDSGPKGSQNNVWKDPVSAAGATANWMKGSWSDPGFGTASPGIQSILKTVGQSPAQQLAAISGSGWASSGYGGASKLQSLLNTVAGTQLPSAPSTPALPKVPTVNGSFSAPSPAPAKPNIFTALANIESARQKLDNNNAPALESGWRALSSLFQGQQAKPPTTAITSQAVNDAVSAGANGDAQRLLHMIHQVSGGGYNQGNHNAVAEPASQVKAQGTDCSGLISWLMGPNGLGLWSTSYATPDIAGAPGVLPGPGSKITIWNNKQPGNAGHVFIQIGNQYFASEGGVGIRQISSSEASNYIQRGSDGGTYQPLHPKGL